MPSDQKEVAIICMSALESAHRHGAAKRGRNLDMFNAMTFERRAFDLVGYVLDPRALNPRVYVSHRVYKKIDLRALGFRVQGLRRSTCVLWGLGFRNLEDRPHASRTLNPKLKHPPPQTADPTFRAGDPKP
jgi:hypothetical protein